MKLFIVPKPVLDVESQVCFYCFRFKRADEIVSGQPYRAYDGAMSSPCFDVLNMAGLNAFSNGLPMFVPLSPITVLMDIENQCKEPHDKLIFLLGGDVVPDEPFISGIERLKSLGYRFALEHADDYQRLRPVLAFCDYVFFDSSSKKERDLANENKRRYKHSLMRGCAVQGIRGCR